MIGQRVVPSERARGSARSLIPWARTWANFWTFAFEDLLPNSTLAIGSTTTRRRPQLTRNKAMERKAKTKRSVWPSKIGGRGLTCATEEAEGGVGGERGDVCGGQRRAETTRGSQQESWQRASPLHPSSRARKVVTQEKKAGVRRCFLLYVYFLKNRIGYNLAPLAHRRPSWRRKHLRYACSPPARWTS